MATRRSATSEVNSSTEARAEPAQDVTMKDGSDAEASEDADGESEEEQPQGILGLIKDTTKYLCEIEENGELLAGGFQRIPNKRMLPDYYEVISVPVAFSTVRGKLLRKTYVDFSEFVRDVAQICHNAQVYNRPSAPIFGAAERLRNLFKARLEKMVEKGQVTREEAALPDLGEIPEAEDSPPPGSDGGEEDDEDEEEDSSESDDDDEEEDGGRRRHGRQRRQAGRSRGDDEDDESNKKRGRPPSVMTPLEARIHNVLRGLRKPKDAYGHLLILPFERLPDKAAVPDYYTIIGNPIALDQIKRKAKRKKYQSVEHAMADVELMFENAKRYNEDGSPVNEAAVALQKTARALAIEEKAKPDDDFRDEDGKLPLAEIQHNGRAWRVGDWVHIRNPNDLAKPIVAQIYRTWQDRVGQKWINACWYYRPEQTVHRFEKHFYDREVVKTGQYRDHHINDLLDHCFVMFVTRFPKGRPRGFPSDKDVYVCESRYNEERFRFNKIKTWASCVPDEVRERDYEMDLFDVPRRMKKLPSPIKHLLREDARESDPLPKPTWGSPNAPPIVGAVHRRPRELNESPPPEATPPPSDIPPTSHMPHDAVRRSSHMGGAGNLSSDRSGLQTASPFPGPGPASQTAVPHSTHSQYHFRASGGGHRSGSPMHQTANFSPHPPHGAPSQLHHQAVQHQPPQQQHHQYQQQQQQQQQQHRGSYQHSQPPTTSMQPYLMNTMTPGYNQSPAGQPSRAHVPPTGQAGISNMYNPPRPPEVYSLPENLDDAIPGDVRENFQTDAQGRVIFFTSPPLDRAGKRGLASNSASLGHSVKYLAGRGEWLAERERKRKERDGRPGSSSSKRATPSTEHSVGRKPQATDSLNDWVEQFDAATARWKEDTGLDGWPEQRLMGSRTSA